LTKRFLKITPTLTSDSHSDELEESDGRYSSPSDRDQAGGVIYPNRLRVLS